MRNIAELSGHSVFKISRYGGMYLKNLDEILNLDAVIKALGEDTQFYFRVILTDPRGWNMRNRLCHGMMPMQEFGPGISDRIIHILLYPGKGDIKIEKITVNTNDVHMFLGYILGTGVL